MTRDKFLEVFCDCYADKNGNHHCENGWICNLCHQPEAEKLWCKIVEKERAE